MLRSELNDLVEKQLKSDREEALSERKAGALLNGCVVLFTAVAFVIVRLCTWALGWRDFSIRDLEWGAGIVVVILFGGWAFSHFDWTIRDKRLIRIELKIDRLLDELEKLRE